MAVSKPAMLFLDLVNNLQLQLFCSYPSRASTNSVVKRVKKGCCLPLTATPAKARFSQNLCTRLHAVRLLSNYSMY